MSSSWSVGLCSCGDSLGTCCLTMCCPCVAFGRIAHIVDDGQASSAANCCLYWVLMSVKCEWFFSCTYRKKMRAKFDLEEQPCNDCCVHFFCQFCALCQEYAELKNRGFDPSKGYSGPSTVPPTQPVMYK